MVAATRSELALGLRNVRKYVAVNGGVLLVAWLVTSIDWVVHACTVSTLASAALGTAALYALVYRVCAANLYGRRRIFGESRLLAIPLAALIWHPLGTMLERLLHGDGSDAPAAVAAVSELLPGWLLPRAFNWYGGLVLRLLAFELTYDFLFYWAHRMAHAHPAGSDTSARPGEHSMSLRWRPMVLDGERPGRLPLTPGRFCQSAARGRIGAFLQPPLQPVLPPPLQGFRPARRLAVTTHTAPCHTPCCCCCCARRTRSCTDSCTSCTTRTRTTCASAL